MTCRTAYDGKLVHKQLYKELWDHDTSTTSAAAACTAVCYTQSDQTILNNAKASNG